MKSINGIRLSRFTRLLGLLAICSSWTGGMIAQAENLVPDMPGSAPNYWCTWSAQNYMHGIGSPSFDPKMQKLVFSSADVTMQISSAKGPIGIFGHYRSLTLQCAAPIGQALILAQDLAGDQAEDITSQVVIKANTLIFPGIMIEKVGLRAASPGDLSDPGLVLVIRKST